MGFFLLKSGKCRFESAVHGLCGVCFGFGKNAYRIVRNVQKRCERSLLELRELAPFVHILRFGSECYSKINKSDKMCQIV